MTRDAREIAREIAYELRGDQLPWSNRGTATMDRALLADRIAAAIEKDRAETIERCAKVADEYASVNIEAAQDTILLDPVLSGRDRHSQEAWERSQDLTIEGCIHSSMFHAAQNIAGAIRALPSPPSEETSS